MSKKKLLHFFLILATVFCSTFYFDNWPNANVTSRAMPVVAQITTGEFHFEHIDSTLHDKSIVDGKHYTDKAPLPTWMMIPIAFCLEKIGLLDLDSGNFESLYAYSGFFMATVPFMFLLFLTWRRGHLKARHPELLILPFFGSFIFAYSASFYSHVFAGLLLVLSLVYLEKRRYLLSGFIMSLVFLSEYPLVLIGFIWGLQLLFSEGFKRALFYAMGFLPGLVVLLVYNYTITGDAFQLLYKYVDPNYAFMHDAYGLGLPVFSVVVKLLFGLYKGLLIYCPVVFLFLYILIKQKVWHGLDLKKVFLNPVFLPFLTMILLISSYEMWWGGWAFGPRHLLAPTILLLYYGLPKLASYNLSKSIVMPTLLFGILISLLSKFTFVYSVPSDVMNPILFTYEEFSKTGSGNLNNWFSLWFDLSAKNAAVIFLVGISSLWFGLIILAKRKKKTDMK